MPELVTSARMRALEQAAIAAGTVSGADLMERAGQGVVAAALDCRRSLAVGAHRASVLCGPGNNGGDGFVIARALHDLGWQVQAFLFGDPARMPADARRMHDRWAALGPVRRLGWDDPCGGFGDLDPDLIVDAVFGIGLTRALPDVVAHALIDISEWRMRVRQWPLIVAVDVPSGLCADSGRDLGRTCRADLTVTFHAAKPGHFLADGPERCGDRVVVVDIGLPRPWSRTPPPGVVDLLDDRMRHVFSKHGGHKYDHGHALVLAGGVGRGGAARLAARGALRVGAGVVTVACPPAALIENAARLDAVMLRAVRDGDGLRAMLSDRRISALCLGPGLGTSPREAGMLAAALGLAPGPLPPPLPQGEGWRDTVGDVPAVVGQKGSAAAVAEAETEQGGSPPLVEGGEGGAAGDGRAGSTPRPTVLDADALTLLAADPRLFAALHRDCVLTPHMGEFARLFPDLADRLRRLPKAGPACSRVDAAIDAAERAGCVVLLKGPDTVIAAPDGRAAINGAAYDRAVPWLATAGSGDVLSGFIAGLLARGVPSFDAACAGAWMHAEAALDFGPGLIAEDLPGVVPRVLRRVSRAQAATAAGAPETSSRPPA
jgi:ADP-dependent NAD(P)H-hydrate dehydratase / NAD(P)H-hydrate epimerase